MGSLASREEVIEDTLNPLHDSLSWDESPPERIALLFAILAIGMLNDPARRYVTMFCRMQRVVAAALNLANVADKPSFVSLQALVIYLYVLQSNDGMAHGTLVWILAGLAFRMAQAVSELNCTGPAPRNLLGHLN